MPEPDRKPKNKAPLSAERIAAEAMALIDAAGLDGFSFRNLAARLGCQAMSLYHYYPSKAHLFEALVEICIAETPIPAEGPHWRERLRQFCLDYRQTALRHPGFFLHFATFRLNNAAGLAFLDRIVSMMQPCGLDTRALAQHFRTIGYYIMGAALDETMGYTNGASAVDPVPADVALRDYPSIAALGAYFGKAHHLETFESGLDALLDRMEAQANAAVPRA